ncbi:MAG: helix-turn-helix transcriptional regulator, partial [Lactovum sp.]
MILETINEKSMIQNTDFQLFLVLSGQIKLIRNSEIQLIETGQIIVINPSETLQIIATDENKVFRITLQIYHEKYSFFQFKLTEPISPYYQSQAYDKIIENLRHLFLELENEKRASNYLIEAYRQQLIGNLLQYLPIEEGHSLKEISERMKKIILFLNQHFSEKLSLDDFAKEFFMSKFHLSHLFKKEMGLTIGEYLKEIRLLQSIKWLESTELTIEEITQKVAFTNQRSFQQAFKEKFHLSPKKYRQERKKSKIENKKIENISEIHSHLSHFLKDNSSEKVEEMNIKVNLEKINKIFRKPRLLFKVNPSFLKKISNELTKYFSGSYVSIDSLTESVRINKNEELDFSLLDKKLEEILEVQMIPYLYIQVQDFDHWQEENTVDFSEMVLQLRRHLLINYPTFSEWFIEFRCFYEEQENSRLLENIVQLIPYFHGITKLMIFYPNISVTTIDIKEETEGEVYCIDHLTRVKKISFDDVVINLRDKKYIQIFKEVHY